MISLRQLKCVESSPTGKSDQMKKIAAYDAFVQMEAGSIGIHKLDAFIISGSKVLEGVGTFLVTSVGVHSSFGKTMMALREESTATPLQMKPNDFAEAIARLGGRTAPLLLFLVFIRFLVSRKGQHFMQILITAITVVLVTVQQGLLLALKLAVAFATIQILRNLARVLQSCETMGNATTICSDKTDSSLTTDPKCEVFLTVVYKPPADEQPDVE
jgi:Ca2+-transporting ATPase